LLGATQFFPKLDRAESDKLTFRARTVGAYTRPAVRSKRQQCRLRSIELWEKLGGAEQLDAAQGVNNLAVLYLKTGRLKEAEPLLLRVLEIREKTPSKDHREVAESLNNLAELYRAQGRYPDAEPLYRRAITIWETRWDRSIPRWPQA